MNDDHCLIKSVVMAKAISERQNGSFGINGEATVSYLKIKLVIARPFLAKQ